MKGMFFWPIPGMTSTAATVHSKPPVEICDLNKICIDFWDLFVIK